MTHKNVSNGKFAKPKRNFSQISNQVLRDATLSLKAKGLYSLIMSYITLPNFVLYKSFLQSQCSEGRCSFNSTWKELVESGYLIHSRMRQSDGTFLYEYELSLPLEEPTPKTESFKRPITDNQSPDSYIYNTISNNTINLSDQETIEKKWQKKIDLEYFKNETSFRSGKWIILEYLLSYLCELEYSLTTNILITPDSSTVLAEMLQNIDSCFILEFLSHMDSYASKNIRKPSAYWRTAFLNYLREHTLSLACS